MRRLFTLFIAAGLLYIPLMGQQDAQYTMYMFNRQVVNPAYAGALKATNITGLGRTQWVGVDGAPNTATISANAYIPALHGGIGGHIIADKLGVLSTTGIKAGYAYHLNLGRRAVLNIGAQGGIYQKKIDGSNWVYPGQSSSDPILSEAITTQIVPDLDAGLYFHIPLQYTTSPAYPQDQFYLGASVSHILEPSMSKLLSDSAQGSTVLTRDIFVTTAYSFQLSPNIYLQPGAHFRMAGPNMQFDINANLYISPMVFGLSHRWKDSFSGIVGFNASSYLFVGYSYDYAISGLGGFTTGSHELIVSYTFPSKAKLPPVIKDTRIDYGDQL